MTRAWLLSSGPIDHDALAHRDAIARVQNLIVTRNASVEESLPLLLAESAKLVRYRRDIDVLITVGESALRAARFGWRGPLIHLCLGRPSRAEIALARSAARRETFRFITASFSIARRARTLIADPLQIITIRPIPSLESSTRQQIRARLQIAPDARVVYVPGATRAGSDHRLAIWAAGMLVFREPQRIRVLIDGGGQDERLRRLIESRGQAPAMLIDDSLRAIDYAVAADVAVCVDGQFPGFAPLAALASVGTPIVASGTLWQHEHLCADVPAKLVSTLKPRLIARAVLDAFDAPLERIATFDESTTTRQWLNVIRSIHNPIPAAHE